MYIPFLCKCHTTLQFFSNISQLTVVLSPFIVMTLLFCKMRRKQKCKCSFPLTVSTMDKKYQILQKNKSDFAD